MESQYDIEQFIQQFTNSFNRYFDQLEDRLRLPIEQITQHFQILINQWTQQHQQLNNNHTLPLKQQLIKTQLQINAIKNHYQQIIDQTLSIVQQKWNQQNAMIIKYDEQMKYVKQLQQCKNQIRIEWDYHMEKNEDQINQNEQANQQYKISIDFESDDTGLESKFNMIDMIDRLNVNHKVAEIYIAIIQENPLSSELIQRFVNDFQNIYHVRIWDCDFGTCYDTECHEILRQLIEKSPLLSIEIFLSSEEKDDRKLKALKQYNEIIQYKEHLESVEYKSYEINKKATSKKEIQELVDQVKQL